MAATIANLRSPSFDGLRRRVLSNSAVFCVKLAAEQQHYVLRI